MGPPSDILRDYIMPDDILGDRYVIESQIGAGAYGAIYLAFDRNTHDEVAIKALPPRGQGSSDTAIGRFERELKVVRNLSHPGIVGLKDYGETPADILYMVMEFIDGQTLEQTIDEKGALPLDESLSLARQIASALKSAHDNGVIHRDLKPANIMLEQGATGPRVKILDFGMAKLFSRLGDESIVALTREGVAVGTPRYIAPEQARGSKRIGPWTDLYALGLLLYEMATGQKAVQHDSVESAVAEHVDSGPLDLPKLGELPEPVQELIRRLTEKDLTDRPKSGEHVVSAIDSLSGFSFAEASHDGGREMLGPPMGGRDEKRSDSGKAPPSAAPRPGEGEPDPLGEPAPELDESAIEEPEREEGEDYELDWNRYEESSDREGSGLQDPAEEARGTGDRLVRFGVGLAATFAWAFVSTAAFLVITAQFHELAYAGRMLLGLIPVFIAGFSALSAAGEGRFTRFLRDGIIFSGIGFLIAHVVGPIRMARELWHDPVWFLAPVVDLPVVGLVADLLTWLAQSYAMLLADLLGPGSGGLP